jgi:hypothetical protein
VGGTYFDFDFAILGMGGGKKWVGGTYWGWCFFRVFVGFWEL